MKTENFDDAFKRKLDSINPVYDEAAIDKVHKYVNQHTVPVSFLSRFGLMMAISGLLIGGLFVWNLIQLNENKSLQKSMLVMEKSLAQAKLGNSIVKGNTINSNDKSINTSESERELMAKQSTQSGNANSTVSKTNSGATVTQQIVRNISNANKGWNKPTASISSKPDYVQNQSRNHENSSSLLNHSNSSSSQNSSNTNSANKGGNSNSSSQNSSTIVAKNTTQNKSILQGIENKSSAADVNSNCTNISDSSKEEKKADEFGAIQLKKVLAKNDSVSTDKKEKKSSRSISLGNLHYTAGMELERGRNQMGTGINAEVFLSKRWSVLAGIKMLNFRNESYHDGDEFHHLKGKDFKGVYTSETSDTAKIGSINMGNDILQIPVRVNYYLPLARNYSLIFSAGTDIDVSSRQHIDYGHRWDPNPEANKHIEVSKPTLAFNNLVFSAGIQKQWGHWALQANPFISPQLTAVIYKKEDLYFGLRLRALYSSLR